MTIYKRQAYIFFTLVKNNDVKDIKFLTVKLLQKLKQRFSDFLEPCVSK